MTDRIRTDRLTPQLRRWVAHPRIGLKATLAFVQARGGGPFKVPTQAAGSVLEQIVGRPAAEAFVELHGGETLSVNVRNLFQFQGTLQSNREVVSSSQV